jgi:hypothetical protein
MPWLRWKEGKRSFTMDEPHKPALMVLLLDADGQRSALAEAIRAAGHRCVIATGIDTALVVLGSLLPDMVLVRAQSPALDRKVAARLTAEAPQVPTRFVEAPAGLPGALSEAPPLN